MFKLVLEKAEEPEIKLPTSADRKSTRLNSSHHSISYAVFCLKKKKIIIFFFFFFFFFFNDTATTEIYTLSLHDALPILFKLVLEKAEEPEIKLPTSAESSKRQENSRKTSISALLIMPKPLTDRKST